MYDVIFYDECKHEPIKNIFANSKKLLTSKDARINLIKIAAYLALEAYGTII